MKISGLLFGSCLITLLAASALAAPWLTPDPDMLDLGAVLAPPSSAHWLGTDELGRDQLSRLLHGGRISLSVAFAAAGLASMIGSAIGIAAGYLGGRVDSWLMRITDGVLALPLLPVLIVLAALDPAKLGFSAETQGGETFVVGRIVVIVALFGWTGTARLVRAETLSVKSRDYVRAAAALGASAPRIMLRHILPNVASPALTAATLATGNVILVESALSFLGMGVQPPMAGWGNMLTGAMNSIWSAPWAAFWPGAAIFTAVLGFNLVGDGLQSRLNPKRRQ